MEVEFYESEKKTNFFSLKRNQKRCSRSIGWKVSPRSNVFIEKHFYRNFKRKLFKKENFALIRKTWTEPKILEPHFFRFFQIISSKAEKRWFLFFLVLGKKNFWLKTCFGFELKRPKLKTNENKSLEGPGKTAGERNNAPFSHPLSLSLSLSLARSLTLTLSLSLSLTLSLFISLSSSLAHSHCSLLRVQDVVGRLVSSVDHVYLVFPSFFSLCVLKSLSR